MTFFEQSAAWAQVMREHRVFTRLVGTILLMYAVGQIADANEQMLQAFDEPQIERAKMIAEQMKWVIGQWIALITLAFGAYSSTGNK